MALTLTIGCSTFSRNETFQTTRIIDGRRVVGVFISPFAYEQFLRGALAMETGDPIGAAEHFRAALSSDSDSSYLLAWLARAQLAAGDARGADRSIALALQHDGRAELAWVVRGEIAEKRGDLVRARTAFETAVRVAPDEADPSVDLGGFLERHGLRAEAVREYERLLARVPQSVVVRRRLGTLLLDLGELDRGIAELERVTRASGAELRSILALAAAQMSAGNLVRASELYRAAMADDDRSQRARRGLIEALLRMRAFDLATEAIEMYRPASDPASLALERAQLLLRADQCDRAAAEADLAAGLRPDMAEARLILGLAHERTGRRDEAMRALAAIPPSSTTFAEARVAMARILVRIGVEDGARALLEDGLRQVPAAEALCLALADLQLEGDDRRGAEATLRTSRSPAARVALARLWLREGRRDRAAAALRAVAGRLGSDPAAVRLLARLELEGGEPESALTRTRRLVERNPSDARSLSLLAVLRARARQTRQARELTARALQLAPVDAEVLADVAEVEELRGARAMALRGYRKALLFGPDRELRARLEARIRRFAARP